MTSVDLLKQLKADYNSGGVSALIGAGFSKNAIPDFPLWTDLLLPIVEKVYAAEFNSLVRKYGRTRKSEKYSKQDREKQACQELLKKYGNLDTVSEYIRREGFGHEAIDTYIEKHIFPAIRGDADTWKCGDKTYPYSALDTHRLLLQCDNFRSIFTTNYDNLLEFSVETTSLTDNLKIVYGEGDLCDIATSRPIVKLHGDIRKQSDEEYQFDGDHYLRYIIAKEDYETYFQKHQGFSYLMRLAMLQGRFCLIGFSGSDPNFLMWVRWMKDILDKKVANDNSVYSKNVTKIFLIQTEHHVYSEASELFYRNHYVGVIDLTDEDVRKELGIVSSYKDLKNIDNSVATSSYDMSEVSHAEMLQYLFRYLMKGNNKKNELPVYNSDNYSELWRKAHNALDNNLDLNDISNLICKAYQSSHVPVDVSRQEFIISTIKSRIIHKDEHLDAAKARLFALAVRDTGTFASYQAEALSENDVEVLDKDAVWQKLAAREQIMMCTDFSESYHKAPITRDKVMLAAFRLDFEKMQALLMEWEPKANEMLHKWMLQSMFNQRETFVKDTDDYIANITDEADKMNACLLRNLQSRVWPREYNISEFSKKGYVSVIDKLQKVADGIPEKRPKRRAYGMVSRSVTFQSSNPPYERSCRVLNMLYDNALVPSYYANTLLSAESWYDVFEQIFEKYPLPVIYYSLFVTDNNIVQRIGQDLAYSNVLYELMPELLIRLLEVLNQKNHPQMIERSVLTITKELYVVVPEDVWYDSFVNHVLAPYMKDVLPNASNIDGWTPNVRSALSYIRSPKHINEIFISLLNHHEVNPTYIDSLCIDYMHLQELDMSSKNIQVEINSIISEGTLKQYRAIYYILSFYEKFSSSQCEDVGRKIEIEDLSFCSDDRVALLQVANLAVSKNQVDIVKSIIMQIDNVWDCGIGTKTISNSTPLDLGKIKWKEEWSEKDMAHIIDNMNVNLNKIYNLKISDSWFLDNYITLLQKMLNFLYLQKDRISCSGNVLEQIDKTAFYLAKCSSLRELLMSNDYFVLCLGFDLLEYQMNVDISRTEESCVEVLLTRAQMLDKQQFQTILGMVCALLKDFRLKMINSYRNEIIAIVNKCKDLDYKELDLNLSVVYAYINTMTDILIEQGIDNKVLNAWRNSQDYIRFNRRW